jgi:hypothetical protein
MAKEKEEDNSVLTDNENYIGTDPIYQNAADVQEPLELKGDEDAGVLDADLATELVDRVKENEKQLKEADVNFRGSSYAVDHPTEAVSRSDQLLKDQQTITRAEALKAEKFLEENQSSEQSSDKPAARQQQSGVPASKRDTSPKE